MYKKISKIIGIILLLAGFFGCIYKIFKLLNDMNSYNEKKVFNSIKEDYENKVFNKKSLALLFSGARIDLNKCDMENDEANLDLFGRFSGISVVVPDNWNVKLSGKLEKSGISNRVDNNDENVNVLNINSNLKYSALDVCNKKIISDSIKSEKIIEEVIDETNE